MSMKHLDDTESDNDLDYRLDLSVAKRGVDAKWSKYKFEQERT